MRHVRRQPDCANEKRLKRRFPLRRELHYKIIQWGWLIATGTGLTSDISSSGIRFTTEGNLPVNGIVEIAVSWPATRQNACPLQLVVNGQIGRREGTSVVCTIERFEFRTQARATADFADAVQPLHSGPISVSA